MKTDVSGVEHFLSVKKSIVSHKSRHTKIKLVRVFKIVARARCVSQFK